MKKLMLVAVLALTSVLLLPSVASAKTPTLKSLAKTVAALQKKVNAQATTINGLRSTTASQATTITSLSNDLTSAKQTIATQGTTLTTLAGQLAQARSDITTLQNAPPSGVSQVQFDALAAKVTTAQGDIGTLQTSVSGLGTTVAGHTASIASLTNVVGTDASHGLQGLTALMYTTLGAVNNKVTAAADVLALEPYVKVYPTTAINGVAGPNIVLQGCNLQIKSKTSEGDTSGTGNLIVGWDTDPFSPVANYRSGSNNLVCGDQNSFLGYGEFVAGNNNTASGTYASVSGGYVSQATGSYASVSGGTGGIASGPYASISGGDANVASGWMASVCGGYANQATGYACSVSGGYNNHADNTSGAGWSYASVSGGHNVVENNLYGWAAGGSGQTNQYETH
jgi:uncharacterized coiled-coil protein SlyX